MMLGSIGFLNGNFEIAAIAGGVEISNFKRTRCDVGLVDDISILPHRDFGVRTCDTTNNWGKSTLVKG